MTTKFEKGKFYLDSRDNSIQECMILDDTQVVFMAQNKNVMFCDINSELLDEFTEYVAEVEIDSEDLEKVHDDLLAVEMAKIIKDVYVTHHVYKGDVNLSINATKAVMLELFKYEI